MISTSSKALYRRTLSTTYRKTHSNKSARSKIGKKKSVLIVIRSIDSRGRYDGTSIEIRSEALFHLLLDLNEDADWWVESMSPPTVKVSPRPSLFSYSYRCPSQVDPKLFFFSHVGLSERLREEQAKTDRDDILISDIEAALHYIAEDHASTIHELHTQINEEQITFNILWALILPNSLVYRHESFSEQDQILRVRVVNYDADNDGIRYALLKCDVVRDDGHSFGLSRERIRIDEFQGLKKIRDLNVYPLKFHPERAAIQEKAITRAHKFAQVKQTLFETHGPAVREMETSTFETRLVKFFVSTLNLI